jgi:ceramide glucosyltransferase
MLLFYFLGTIAIWLGWLSLRGGIRFSKYIQEQTAIAPPNYTPVVSVIAPFRGAEPQLRENIAALFEQRYPAYEIIFVTDSQDDPGLPAIESACAANANEHVQARVFIAGAASDSGQKVHNLRKAVAVIDSQSDVIVFVDSDARPHEHWLRFLVAPLVDKSVGAATGYRWFVPPPFSLWGHLRAAWNASIASALGAREDKNFCWGGATAIRRETFLYLNVLERWRGSVSDDFTLTRTLQDAKLPIKFVPQCLTATTDRCGFRELLEFTTRQLKITRTYAAPLWKAVLLGSAQFVLVFFGGMILMTIRAMLGLSITYGVLLLVLLFLLGAAKSLIRLRAVKLAMSDYKLKRHGEAIAQTVLWPFATALFLYNAVVASWSRRITWRGITYELKSPDEAVIISRETQR